MYKLLLFILLPFILCSSDGAYKCVNGTVCRVASPVCICKGEGLHDNKDEYRALRDSMVDLFQEGMLHEDTALVMQSWSISEHLLAVDNDHAAQCYHHRAILLGWLGRMKEARENKWLEIQHLPNSNPDRLVYMSKKYTIEHNGDSAKYYITRLLDFCDNNKHCKQDYRDYLRIIAVSLADGPSKGKVLLHKLLRANPRNDLLHELQKNWKAFVESLSQDV